MNCKKLWNAVTLLRSRGIGFLFIYFTQCVWFDIRNRSSTFMRRPQSMQDPSLAQINDGLLYVASFTSVIFHTLDIAICTLKSHSPHNINLIDLGCGRGKVLLVCGKFYTNKIRGNVIGLEYDAFLADCANRNIMKVLNGQANIKVYNDSATKFSDYVGSGHYIIYLYNSFVGKTLEEVICRLGMIDHVLVYVDPVEWWRFEEIGYEIIECRVGRYNADTWIVAKPHRLP
jgi:hypothetical protein